MFFFRMSQIQKFAMAWLALLAFCRAAEISNNADLWQAIHRDDRAQVEALVKEGNDLNKASDVLGGGPLHWARGEEMVALLLKLGADPLRNDAQNITPLMEAARNANTGGARLLLNRGLNINAKDNNGRTALYYSAGNLNPDFADFLLEKGATIDAQDSSGTTVLMRAVIEPDVPLVKLLLKRGAKRT